VNSTTYTVSISGFKDVAGKVEVTNDGIRVTRGGGGCSTFGFGMLAALLAGFWRGRK
jgi:hypothetical protein